MKLRNLLACATLTFAMFSAMEASAQQNLNVSATVPEVCVITTPGTALNLTFGNLAVDTAIADFTATVDFLWRCSLGTAATISLDSGLDAGADGNTRFMSGSNGGTLAYELTTDSGANWGDDGNGAPSLGVLGQGMLPTDEVATPINGTIVLADAQAAIAGDYTDTVLITLLP